MNVISYRFGFVSLLFVAIVGEAAVLDLGALPRLQAQSVVADSTADSPVKEAQAQEDKAESSAARVDLDWLQPGLGSITEKKVKETVSFLASDEMAGRATLSPGFERAADWVADRFKKAGLKPGAGESFFHVTKVATTRTPTKGIRLQADGKDWDYFGLLSGGAEAVEGTYPWHRVEVRAELDQPFEGVAVAKLDGDAGSRRWLAQLARLANSVRLAGGKALLLQVGEDNSIVGLAKQMQSSQLEDERTRFMIPVLLIPTAELPEGDLQMSLPAQERQESDARNVIGVLEGSDPTLAEEFVLISAHLDHLPPNDSGEDRINNGADDNATGVTAVVCLAEAFASLEKRPARSVVFMTFWGEERGLVGSRRFAENPSIELQKIVANINIEMIGRPEAGANGKVWVTGWEKSNLGPLMAPAAQQVGVTIFEHPKYSSMLYGSSDNYSFAAKGVVAHSFSAGSLHSDYHRPSDEWEKLELAHMTEVIRGLFAGTFPIANGQVTPAAN